MSSILDLRDFDDAKAGCFKGGLAVFASFSAFVEVSSQAYSMPLFTNKQAVFF